MEFPAGLWDGGDGGGVPPQMGRVREELRARERKGAYMEGELHETRMCCAWMRERAATTILLLLPTFPYRVAGDGKRARKVLTAIDSAAKVMSYSLAFV